MLLFKYIVVLSILFVSISACQDTPAFLDRVDKGIIQNDDIDEASGLVVSRKNTGILWTHNDSGGESKIFAIDTNGSHIGQIKLLGIENRDWEDLAIGPGTIENESYIYIGDIGDNNARYSKKYIYYFPEPDLSDYGQDFSVVISDISKISFTYPDGERDAETLMLDPLTKDLLILGKRDSKVRLYKISYPFPVNTVKAELVDKISFPFDPQENTPYNYITGGDISFDGSEIIIKTYMKIYYWNRKGSNSISEVLSRKPIVLPYTPEPQGEAVCWKNNADNGYYTISEEREYNQVRSQAHLYYYPRKIDLTNIKEELIENDFSLLQNFPNPFNPVTTLKYSLKSELKNKKSKVQITVYDIMGQYVATLVDEYKASGIYEVKFNASNIPSGIYFYNLTFGDFSSTKKMIVLK